MANYYKTLSCSNLLLSDGIINQKKGSLNIELNGAKIIEVKNNDAYLNSNRILTTADIYYMVVSFGSGIYKKNGPKFLRYKGTADSGYDTNLRVANIFNVPFSICVRQISIQKGFSGENTISIPAINYTKTFSGLFFVGDINVNLPKDSKLYIEITGEPSLETSVDIYYNKTTDNTLYSGNLSFVEEVRPIFDELFTFTDNMVTTRYSLRVLDS